MSNSRKKQQNKVFLLFLAFPFVHPHCTSVYNFLFSFFIGIIIIIISIIIIIIVIITSILCLAYMILYRIFFFNSACTLDKRVKTEFGIEIFKVHGFGFFFPENKNHFTEQWTAAPILLPQKHKKKRKKKISVDAVEFLITLQKEATHRYWRKSDSGGKFANTALTEWEYMFDSREKNIR